MKKRRIAISDIAKQLNVSVTTVSFILNGKAAEKRISKNLTKKVQKFASDIGYVPNQLAKSLRTGKTNIIALIVEDISNPFFASIARLIEENADKKGYKIIYCSSESNTLKTRELIKVFRERQVDGYIITPVPGIEEDLKALLNEQFPVILFDRFLPELKTDYVVVDNMVSTCNAITHLLAQGFRNIGFVTLSSEQTQMAGRLEGYKKAMRESGRKPFVKKVDFQDDHEKIVQQIADFLGSKKELDAVFFATNYLGISGLEAIRRLQLSIPSNLGVISFDDHDLFRLYTPTITVVAQPVEEMSRNIINLLLHQLDEKGDGTESAGIVLPGTLIVRESTCTKQAPLLVELSPALRPGRTLSVKADGTAHK